MQPSYAAYKVYLLKKVEVNNLYYTYKVFQTSSLILCSISVLTSTAISVDRLLALLLGLRYRHVVTLRRVRVVITFFWLIGASTGGIWVWREDIGRHESTTVITLSLVVSVFCYSKIHLKLRKTARSITKQCSPRTTERSRKSAEHSKRQKDIF